MTRIKPVLMLASLLLIIIISCVDDDSLDPKYQRPEWLAGKLYDQILEQEDLSTFAECIKLTGYDEIINVSGSYTVFAPTNEAFNEFFASNPNYNSVQDIPQDELSNIVKYHIVQNPWSKNQLRTLDVYGWIDTLDINNDEPRGFKRETLLLNKNRKYGVAPGNNKNIIIVDTLQSNWTRKVATDSRKFVPVFFQQYLDIYDLNRSDYEFYFNRPFEGDTNLYYAGAKVVSAEIFAENGFIYEIDKVVTPLQNAAQIMADESGQHKYTDFLSLVNSFPDFQYNDEKTKDQSGADQGLVVDSLFDLTYPDLTFNITGEKTKPPTGTYGLPQDVTIRYHHGIMAPTNTAYANFENQFFRIPRGWGSINGSPDHVKRIIVNTHLSINPVYPTDFEEGFYNGENDIIKLDEGNIVEKEFGSNATFIGLSDAIVPRAFSSITGPIYLQQGFSKVMFAIEQAGLLAALKRPGKNYSFFIESNANTSADSSLIYDQVRDRFSVFQISPGGFQQRFLNQNDLRTLLLNHVATEVPKGIARKEFIPNLAGNFLIFDNETGIVSGTGPTTVGYQGTMQAPNFPTQLTQADNGVTYEVNNWFSFTSSTIYTKISTTSKYSEFHRLLQKAGLSQDKEFRYNFLSDTEFYTVFIPSNEALKEANVNAMTIPELRKFLMLHFVQGALIFTDGSKPAGYYETARVDEASTPFSTVYTQIYIDPGIDEIGIQAKDGSDYVHFEESQGTNILVGVNLSEGQSVYPNIYNNGVIHEIDKVLKVEELDTN